jgi:uncharacterized RDD family membrane protein YckC/cytoskeletal protein CcmA (bactofilin family)
MKLVKIITSLTGAGIALAFTFALVVPAQEPPPEPAPVEQAEDPLRVLGEDADVADIEAEVEAEAEQVVAEAEAKVAEVQAEVVVLEEAQKVASRKSRHSHNGAPTFFSRLVVGPGDYYREAVSIMGSVLVEKGGKVGDAAVAIMGDTVVDGDVDGEAVAILGDMMVNGRVGGEAVAILGDSTIDGVVEGELVTILGRVRLGPEAHIQGDLISVGGKVERAPGARVDGNIQEIAFLGDNYYAVDGLKTWIKRCLLLGRPLAFGENLGWAWGLAIGALACYFFIALLFPDAVKKCVRTLETKPGLSIVASILSLLLAPILAIILSVTVVGPIILGFFLFFAAIFGKVVFFAWMGRRMVLPLGITLPAAAVLMGGVVTLFIYVIPVMGGLFQQLAGFLGLGVVIYTIILTMQADRADRPKVAVAGAGASNGPPVVVSTAASAAAAAVNESAPEVPPVPTVESTDPVEPSGDASHATAAAAAATEEPAPPPLRPEPQFQPKPVADGIQFSTMPRAGFWIRCAATLLDIMLIGVVLNILETRMFTPTDYFPLMAAIYFITFWALKGTTIGGVVCGLKVVRLDDRPVDWSVALIRGLGGFLSLFVIGLGFVWVAFDNERQSWHDKIAGTTIVKVPRGVSLI